MPRCFYFVTHALFLTANSRELENRLPVDGEMVNVRVVALC